MFKSNSAEVTRLGRLAAMQETIKPIPVGKTLLELQRKIALGYPEGTRIRVTQVWVEIEEPGKDKRTASLSIRDETRRSG